jgi:CBS domain-containing protein
MRHEASGSEVNGRKVQQIADQAAMAAAQTTVSSIMTREVVTVRPDTSLETLIQLLLERNFSGVPVVDEDRRPIGIVSKTDLVRERQDSHQDGHDGGQGSLRVAWRRGISYQPGPGYHLHEEDATAAELMTSSVVTIPESGSIQEAAKLMLRTGIHRLPVISPTGSVVGLVTTTDVLSWVAGG